MNEENTKSEFIQKLEQVADELTKASKGQKGKGIILLGMDSEEKEGGDTCAVLAVVGNGKQLIELLAQFIANPQTKPLVDKAMMLATFKRISENITD